MRVTVIGAGSWGTALAINLGRKGISTALVTNLESAAEHLKAARENQRFLPGFVIPECVTIVGPGEAVPVGDFAVLAVPTALTAEALPSIDSFQTVCVASKGLEPGTGRVLSEVVEQHKPGTTVVALSGPNLAVELARGIPTAAVSASPDESAAMLVREAFSCSTLRVYISEDRKGVEIAGALKNVIAIGAGMSDGLGFGDNTKGAFLSRGLGEMVRLGLAMGAKMETFLGMAGVGDLFATANSSLSRNYRVGYALGKGDSLEQAVESLGQVAEGVPTAKVALELAAKHQVEVPLMETLYRVMHGQDSVAAGLTRLMERQTLREIVL